MTEISEAKIDWPVSGRYAVDRWQFTRAAIWTPILFGLSGTLVFGFGVFFTLGAVIAGFPVYATVGLPIAWYTIRNFRDSRGYVDLGVFFIVGLLVNVASLAGAYLYFLLDDIPYRDPGEYALGYAALGLIAGPIQATLFGWLYQRGVEREARKFKTQTNEGEA